MGAAVGAGLELALIIVDLIVKDVNRRKEIKRNMIGFAARYRDDILDNQRIRSKYADIVKDIKSRV